MRANRSDHRLFQSNSLDVQTNENTDAISYASLNFDQSSNIYYKNTTANPTVKRRLKSPAISHEIDGININGSLFDTHLFQSNNSSYIHDYGNTPKDFNRFLEGHHSRQTNSHLNPHLFKMSFILTLSEWHVDKEVLLDSCPQNDSNNEELLKEVSYYKKFCFPELNPKATNGGDLLEDLATYVFTRTNSIGEVEYGYCRRITYNNQISKYPIVICIVSTYAYFKLYDAILTELSSVYVKNELECSLLMQSFYSKPIPLPTLDSSGIICKLNNRRLFSYICPKDDRLSHDYFSTLLSTLSPDSIVYLFESMLRSKKILLFSNTLSKLTKCCLGLSFLLYPFTWTYPFVSLMPSSWLQDLIDSPCPYIYGCLTDITKQLSNTLAMEKDSVRVDLDTDTIEVGLNDGFCLPLDLRQICIGSLEYLIRFRLIKSDLNLINIACHEACLHVFIELLHCLPDYFQRDEQKPKIADAPRRVSVTVNDLKKFDFRNEENRLGYEFRSDEFLIRQPTSSYVVFLNEFIRGMMCLKFLDDYQRPEQPFSLFTQRLQERRRMTFDDLSINPVIRFRQTFDLLEKQMKISSKSTTTPIFSRLVKKLF